MEGLETFVGKCAAYVEKKNAEMQDMRERMMLFRVDDAGGGRSGVEVYDVSGYEAGYDGWQKSGVGFCRCEEMGMLPVETLIVKR